MLKLIPLAAAGLLITLPLIAQDGGPVLRVVEAEDQIVAIRAKTRHTTVIVLPATETVLDFVVGDSEYWHLTGAANLAFLKPDRRGGHHQRGAGVRVRADLLVSRHGTQGRAPPGGPHRGASDG